MKDTSWAHALEVAADGQGLVGHPFRVPLDRRRGQGPRGWTVLDLDGTLITAHSGKDGAAPTWKKGYGFHPLAAWCINTRGSPR